MSLKPRKERTCEDLGNTRYHDKTSAQCPQTAPQIAPLATCPDFLPMEAFKPMGPLQATAYLTRSVFALKWL